VKLDKDAQIINMVNLIGRTPMEKKLDNITKVIHDPDEFNVNIASRERIEELEQRIERLEKKMKRLIISTRKR